MGALALSRSPPPSRLPPSIPPLFPASQAPACPTRRRTRASPAWSSRRCADRGGGGGGGGEEETRRPPRVRARVRVPLPPHDLSSLFSPSPPRPPTRRPPLSTPLSRRRRARSTLWTRTRARRGPSWRSWSPEREKNPLTLSLFVYSHTQRRGAGSTKLLGVSPLYLFLMEGGGQGVCVCVCSHRV